MGRCKKMPENKTQKEDSIVKLGLILLLITSCAAILLGFMSEVTEEPIRIQRELENKAALEKVLPEADDYTNISGDYGLTEDSLVREVYSSTNDAGYVFKVYPKGYGGEIEIVVSIDKDNKIGGVEILSHAETPGLGANATNDEFKGQYQGKETSDSLEVVKGAPASNPNEIEAITGATITSRAVTTGVNAVLDFYKENIME